MATSAAQLATNLGYFTPFMRAWGRADPPTRAQVYADTLSYRAGQIDGATEVADVSALLQIPPP